MDLEGAVPHKQGHTLLEGFWVRASFKEHSKRCGETGHDWLGSQDFLLRLAGPIF